MSIVRSVLIFLVVFCTSATTTLAGGFHARLAPMPVDFRSAERITGLGELQGWLEGSRLHLRGSFGGLQAPANKAQLHEGPLAIPGPAIGDLQVSAASEGTIQGSIMLTDAQLQKLSARGLYVQIGSQAAPEGNLRGWLLPDSSAAPVH